MNKDNFWDSVNNAIKSEKVVGLCSFCKTEIKPVFVAGSLTNRDYCICPNKKCNQPIVVCLTPGCDNYANGSLIRRPLCQWCFQKATPNVGNTFLKVGSAIATSAAALYIKKRFYND
ncbi:hypothetical protein [Pseudoalteromonas sp. Angola-18]|uniref:hypothetical protein n=1 Tax=Pseudoalteromonas sp. Angola-18 TaxID=3025338 RepID=UPI002358DCE9|nr:hypothetical protein [Pseudoalteromonas sp. Angola-18]MDC9502856.1 hypothetical protein [Pseudoalteromonas sp. Angola-18]